MNFPFFRKRRDDAEQPMTQQEAGVDAYMISHDLIVTLVMKGQTRLIPPSHQNHEAIVAAIREGKWSLLADLVDVPAAMSRYTEGNIEINEFGEVSFKGEPISNTVADRISQFFQAGLPYQPLVRFLERLMENPSGRSVKELYNFLEHQEMAITEDGCFMAYKGVRGDFKDKHSGTFDNSPGETVRLAARNMVDDDCRMGCSYGLHVGSQEYAASWAGSNGKVVLVKVDPADAVSVPSEAGHHKLRVVGYEVIREVQGVIDTPLFAGEDLQPVVVDLDDDEDYGHDDEDDDYDY